MARESPRLRKGPGRRPSAPNDQQHLMDDPLLDFSPDSDSGQTAVGIDMTAVAVGKKSKESPLDVVGDSGAAGGDSASEGPG